MSDKSISGYHAIESKIRNYFNFKYPVFYHLQFIVYPITFILWLLGSLFGLYIYTSEKNFGSIIWLIFWSIGGCFSFYWGIWYKGGKQIIKIDIQGIVVSKKFLFYHRSKLVPKENILTIDYRELKPYNIFTGRDIEIKERLGWLVINGDSNYASNSYLYQIEDLEDLINVYLSVYKTDK